MNTLMGYQGHQSQLWASDLPGAVPGKRGACCPVVAIPASSLPRGCPP